MTEAVKEVKKVRRGPVTIDEFELLLEKPARRRYFKGMVFGPYGVGKTTLIETANDDSRTAPALLLGFEGGESSIADSDIDMIHIDSWETYNKAFAFLLDGKHPYKSVLIDSITETHIFALFEILNREGGARRNPDLIEQGDYGTASVQLRRLIREFRDLPMHLFVTALDREEVDIREGTVKKPALSGRLADELPGILDIVAYLTLGQDEDTKETVRLLLLQNYSKFRAKVRVPPSVHAPNEILEPTVTKLLDVLGYREMSATE